MEEESTAEEILLKNRKKGFEKNPGPAIAQKGAEYQIKIAELFVTLALQKENIFYNLSMEDKSAEKFDDLVFKVLYQGQYICWFIQAKHREKGAIISFKDLLCKQNGDFYLRKYFQSFLDIRKGKISAEASASRYIIYTPAYFDFDNRQTDEDFSYLTSENNSLRLRKVTEEHDLLDASRYSMFEILADDFINRHLKKTSGATDEDVEDFLQHLRFAVGQPTVEDFSNILLTKLKEAAGHIDTHIFRDNISREIRKSFMESTSNSKYFTEIQIAKLILRILSEMYNNSFLLDVTFSSCDLIDKIRQTDKCIIHIRTCNPTLCCSKLINHLDVCQEKLFLLFAEFVKVSNIVLPSLPLREELLIIVVCDMQEKSEMWNETLQSLLKRFVSSGDKTDPSSHDKETHVNRKQKTNASKLILVSSSFLDFNMCRMPDLHKNIFCVEDDTYNFESLSCKSQDSIMQKVVTFQGVPAAFNNLCREDSMPPFDSYDIETLVSEVDIILGESGTSVENKQNIFIPREFYVKSIVEVDRLHTLVDKLFILVTPNERDKLLHILSSRLNLSITELSGKKTNIHLVTMEKADAEFTTLYKTFQDKTIHKLKVNTFWYGFGETIQLQWLETHGAADALFKYISDSASVDVERIQPNPISILAAEPGMGKTTLLSHIAGEEKKNNSNRWVVNVRLKDVARKFLNLNPSDSISTIAKRLSEVLLEGESSLSKHLFQYSLEVTGNFIVLLDGYDEIGSNEEREKVRIVLQKLKENSLGQVIITTRLHFKEELELAVSSIAYRLKPLTASKQEKLLAQTWIMNLGISSNEEKSERVHVYARELLKDFSNKVDKRIESFIGIPLLVVLLGEVYENECNTYCNKKDPHIESVNIRIDNVSMLYRSFEEKKYKDFCKKEQKQGISINRKIKEMISDEHRKICVEVALHELFPLTGFPCYCCLKSKPKSVLLLEENEILRIGILQMIGGRGLSFIHRTFAEYFFVIHHILQINKYCKKFVKAFKSGFYESRFSMVRLFLGSALATSTIHKAALTNDAETVKKELEKGTSVNLRDALGRTPCHLAASYGHVEAAELFLTRGCNTHIKDGLHKYTPVQVAAKVGKWEICSLFLSKRRNIELDIEEKCTLFRYLCQNGKAEPLKQMLNKRRFCLNHVLQFQQIFYSTDRRGPPGLNTTIVNGNVEVIRILLDKCKDYSVQSIQDERIKNILVFSSCDVERQRECMMLVIKEAILSNWSRTLLENMFPFSSSYTDYVQCLLECDVPLKDVLLSTLLHGKDSDLEKVFMKVGKVHDDIVSFILQPFESHETMLHFSAVHGTETSVIFLIKTLETEGENILNYILPPDLQQLPLLHHAVMRNYIKLCDLLIQKVRESEGNVGEFISQKDHLGRTPLHWAAYRRHIDMVKFLILKMKNEETPIFEGTSKVSLVSCHESGDEIQLFETLYMKIMKHGCNLLAYILQTDSAQTNILDFLGEHNDERTCNENYKINAVFCVEWIRDQMKSDLVNQFQAISTTFNVANFMNFIILKSNEKRNAITYLIASENEWKESALSAAASGNHFEIFKVLTEEIEKEGGDLIHMIDSNDNYIGNLTLIASSVYGGHIQILEFILHKIKRLGAILPDWNPYRRELRTYILQTFSQCLMKEEISSSQLEEDVMMVLNEDPELLYFPHGLVTFCNITVLRTYFEIIRQNDLSLDHYITRRNDQGKTTIHCVAERGRKEVVEYLLEEVEEECGDCSHCFYPNDEGWTLLHSASIGGNTCLVGFILDKLREYKANTLAYILQKTTRGRSAIHYASSNGHAEVVKLLLTVIEMRSSVLLKNILCKQEYKNTLLRDAASHGDVNLLDFVVQKCTRQQRERGVLKRGSKVKKKKKFAKYILNLTWMKIKKRKTRLRKSSSIFRFVFGNCKSSPVYYAIRKDNVQVIQFLFENVGSKRVRNYFVKDLVNCFHGTNTRSPFHYAHIHGSWKCLSYLIQLVVNRVKYLKNYLYSRDQHGKTLLHYSISSGNVSVSTLLLQTMCEEEGEDILQWSFWSSMTLEEFLQSLLKKRNIELFVFVIRLMQRGNEGSILSFFSEQIDTEKSVIYYMAKHVDREILDLFLRDIEKEGGDIFHYLSTPHTKGKKLLEGALFYENYAAAEYLVGVIKERGKDATDYFCKEDFITQIVLERPEMKTQIISDLKYLNDYFNNSCTVALRNDMTEVANLLSDVTETVNQNFLNYLPPNENVKTHLPLAIATGNIDMLDFILSPIEGLIDAKFLEYRDSTVRGAIYIAAKFGNKIVMEFLFRKVKQEHGGSCSLLRILSVRDGEGVTPFSCAVKSGDIELVKFLLKTIKEETLSIDHCTQDHLD